MGITKNRGGKGTKNRRDAHGVRERRVPEKEYSKTGRRGSSYDGSGRGESRGARTTGNARIAQGRGYRGDARMSRASSTQGASNAYRDYGRMNGYPQDDQFQENQPERTFLVGRNPVIEALRAGREIEKIFIAEGTEGSIGVIKALAKENGVIIDTVERVALNRMAPGEKHQGVIAEIPAYSYSSMEDIFGKAEASGEAPFIVILDEITDPHNLGAVIRTAECAGAHGVIIPKRRACGLTGTVAKSAAGAIETIPVVRVTNMARTIEELKERGIWVAACDMDGDVYYDADLGGAIAIVIGNEGKGISRIVKEKCDFVVSIPMKGQINSLNASNAAAIIMYEVRRRRELNK